MSRRTPPFLYNGDTQDYRRYYAPGQTLPSIPPGWPGTYETYANGWTVYRFADVSDDPTNTAAAPLPDPGEGEINQLAHHLVTSEDNAVFVVGSGGDSDQTATYSNGALPTDTTFVVVPDGATLTFPAGSSFVCHTLRFNPGSAGHVEKGIDAANPTEIETNTVIVHRGATLTADATTATEQIDWVVNNLSDIDPVRDPLLLGLGFIFCEGSTVSIAGTKRRSVMAFANTMTAGVSDTLTLGHPIFTDDPVLPSDDWAAGDNIYFRGAEDATGILTGYESLGGECAQIESRNGADAILTQACANSHTMYHDETRRVEAMTMFGPPSGSHAEWGGRGLAFNLTRFTVFREKDPTGPIHRRPYIMRASDDCELKWIELQGFGRSNARKKTGTNTSEMLYPDGQVNAADTNLRYRDPVTSYRLGYHAYDDQENWPAHLEGVSVWGGPTRQPLGDTYDNDCIGEGSPGRAFSFYECTTFTRECLSFNTIAAGHATLSVFTPGIWYRGMACESWGMNEAGSEPILKNNYDYQTHEMGARGEGFFFTRAMALVQCIAVGCKHVAAHTNSRPETQGADLIQTIFCNLGPESFEYRQFVNRELLASHPLLVEGLYALGCGGGLVVVKSAANMDHSIPSHLKNIFTVACRRGDHIEYAGNYPILNRVDLGPLIAGKPSGYFAGLGGSFTGNNASVEFQLGVPVSTIVRCYSAHRQAAWSYLKKLAGPPGAEPTVEEGGYEGKFGVDRTTFFANAIVNPILRDTADIVLPAGAYEVDPEKEIFTSVSTPFEPAASVDLGDTIDFVFGTDGGVFDIEGTFTDGLGSAHWMATGYNVRQRRIDGGNVNRLIGYKGYYEDSGSANLFFNLGIAVPNRLLGSYRVVQLPIATNALPGFTSGLWTDPETGEFLTPTNHGEADFATLRAAAEAALGSSSTGMITLLETVQTLLD